MAVVVNGKGLFGQVYAAAALTPSDVAMHHQAWDVLDAIHPCYPPETVRAVVNQAPVESMEASRRFLAAFDKQVLQEHLMGVSPLASKPSRI